MEWYYESFRDKYTYPSCGKTFIKEEEVNAPKQNNTHIHHNIEIIYMLSGKLELRLFGSDGKHRSVFIGKNDALVINSGILHWSIPCEAGEYMLAFIPPNSLMLPVRLEIGKTFLSPYHDDESMTVGNLMYTLHRYSRLGEPGAVNNVLLPSLANSIMSLILPKLDGEMFELGGRVTESELLTYVYMNYRNPELTSECVAKSFGFTARKISGIFRASVGVGLKKHIDRLRIHDAMTLLRNTDQSVESIALEIGYDCPRTFFRVFSQELGVTPGEYRRSGKPTIE